MAGLDDCCHIVEEGITRLRLSQTRKPQAYAQRVVCQHGVYRLKMSSFRRSSLHNYVADGSHAQ